MSRRPATSLLRGPYLRRLHGHQEVRELLRQELLALPVAAFNRLVARLLLTSGYRTVQVLGEARGGADLVASAPCGLSTTRTLIQAKQYQAPVSRRFVDELRGAMLRHQACQGLLLTTSTFFGPAYGAASLACPLPVRLVDGEELLDLLLAQELGVHTSRSGHLGLDREFLAALALGQDQGPPEHTSPTAACAACEGGHEGGDGGAR